MRSSTSRIAGSFIGRLALVTLGLAFQGWMLAASAQPFPSRPVKIVVGAPPGQSSDLLSRVLATHLSPLLGQPVLIDNRPGAGASLGPAYVAKSPPDGYTILLGTSGPLTIRPNIYSDMPYDSVKSFDPIVALASAPMVFGVSAASPYRSLDDIVRAAKSDPNAINFGSPGVGSINHLSAEMFAGAAGIKVPHVPYKGSPAVFTDIIGGRITFVADPVPGILPLIKGGKLKAVGVASPQRSPMLPDVATFEEQGFKGFTAAVWFGLLAPAGTPDPVLDRLAAEIAKVVAMPEMQKQFTDWGLTPLAERREAYRTLIAADIAKWRKVVQDVGGIKPE
jgi:tripartite-type tricarboxylate transporter receptor subunit TctC